MTRRPLLVLLMACTLLTGCARFGDDPAEDAGDGLPSGAAGTPAVVVPSTAPLDDPGAGTSTTVDGGTPTTAASAPTTTSQADRSATSTTAPPAASAGPMTSRLDLADPAGDHDVTRRAPDHADGRALRISANAVDVAVEVDVAAAIPAVVPDGGVQGLGVDLFVESDNPRLSDSQLFAIGNADGWFAYLTVGRDEPRALPGTFTIDGSTFRFEISWEDLRLPDGPLRTSAFVDYSRRGDLVNVIGDDRLPASGTADVAR